MDSPEKYPRVVLSKGGAWHEPELLRRGYTPEKLARARKNFGIIAWQDRFGGWHYPKWQFDADDRVLPKVADILRVFRSPDTLYVMSQFLVGERPARPLLELIRAGQGEKAVEIARERVREIAAEGKLSRKESDELGRRLREMDDPVRFVVVSSFLRRWAMVYDVGNNVYSHQHISEGCLIKDRRVAETIVKQLGAGSRTSELHVLPVRKTTSGYRALENIPATKRAAAWRPRFRTPKTTPTFVAITESNTRAHQVDAMLFAAEHRDELMQILARSPDRKAAAEQLVFKVGVTPRQAETILEMRFFQMTKQSVSDLTEELSAAVRPAGENRRRRRRD